MDTVLEQCWSSSSNDSNTNTNKNYYRQTNRIYSPIKEAVRDYSPLRETPREYFECLEDSECHDELFLLPEQVLDMDSYVVREDLSAIVPSFRKDDQHDLLDIYSQIFIFAPILLRNRLGRLFTIPS